MSEMDTLSLRIFGRDLTLACPPEEKDQLNTMLCLLAPSIFSDITLSGKTDAWADNPNNNPVIKIALVLNKLPT